MEGTQPLNRNKIGVAYHATWPTKPCACANTRCGVNGCCRHGRSIGNLVANDSQTYPYAEDNRGLVPASRRPCLVNKALKLKADSPRGCQILPIRGKLHMSD